jgi:hypothetical protein
MGSVSENYQCPWCRRTNGGYAPDWVGYAICTEGAFSCLWHHSLDNEHTHETVVALFKNGWALHYVFVKKFDVGWCTRVWEFCAPGVPPEIPASSWTDVVQPVSSAFMHVKVETEETSGVTTAHADDIPEVAPGPGWFRHEVTGQWFQPILAAPLVPSSPTEMPTTPQDLSEPEVDATTAPADDVLTKGKGKRKMEVVGYDSHGLPIEVARYF